jgi:hypothetical protein
MQLNHCLEKLVLSLKYKNIKKEERLNQFDGRKLEQEQKIKAKDREGRK